MVTIRKEGSDAGRSQRAAKTDLRDGGNLLINRINETLALILSKKRMVSSGE